MLAVTDELLKQASSLRRENSFVIILNMRFHDE